VIVNTITGDDMNKQEMIKKILETITEAEDNRVVKVRGGGKGYSASSVITPRKPLMGFGKSYIEKYYEKDEKPEADISQRKKVNVSKVFIEKEELEDLKEIIQELIDETKLYR
jgi:hypothetical protein